MKRKKTIENPIDPFTPVVHAEPHMQFSLRPWRGYNKSEYPNLNADEFVSQVFDPLYMSLKEAEDQFAKMRESLKLNKPQAVKQKAAIQSKIMINTKSQNFMPDQPWPRLTTTALPAAVSQRRSDKYATETHKTITNKEKQAACDRPQAVVPCALRSRNQLPRCGQPGSNNRPDNPKCTHNPSNTHSSFSSSSSLSSCFPSTDATIISQIRGG
ncbi:unnamed protein product [Trichobilharzia regenti]|nr:unnamed protein product [Trichobilharzia regenti]